MGFCPHLVRSDISWSLEMLFKTQSQREVHFMCNSILLARLFICLSLNAVSYNQTVNAGWSKTVSLQKLKKKNLCPKLLCSIE